MSSAILPALVTTPAIAQFKLIDSDTKTASDLDGTPATDPTNDLAVMGQDAKNKMAMLMTLASADPKLICFVVSKNKF